MVSGMLTRGQTAKTQPSSPSAADPDRCGDEDTEEKLQMRRCVSSDGPVFLKKMPCISDSVWMMKGHYGCCVCVCVSVYPVCEAGGHGRIVSTAGGLENHTLFPVVPNVKLFIGLPLEAKQPAVGQIEVNNQTLLTVCADHSVHRQLHVIKCWI